MKKEMQFNLNTNGTGEQDMAENDTCETEGVQHMATRNGTDYNDTDSMIHTRINDERYRSILENPLDALILAESDFDGDFSMAHTALLD